MWSKTTGFRKWVRTGAALTVALAAVAGCAEEEFTADEWRKIDAIQPLKTEMPGNLYNDPANPRMVDIAKLGQMLFFEKQLAEAITVTGPSGNMGELGKVGCVNCHDNAYFSDSRPGRVSHGRTGFLARNSPALVNLGYYEWTLWTGRFDSMVDHGAGAWGTSATQVHYARFLYAKYKDEYNTAFPETPIDERLGINPLDTTTGVYPATANPKAAGAADGPYEKMPEDARQAIYQIRANLGRAWDAYPRQLTTPNSPFEVFVKSHGDTNSLTDAQKRGVKLFIGKAGCMDCHNGPMLTDSQFHNIGVADPLTMPGSTTNPAPDRGRAASIVAVTSPLAQVTAWETMGMPAATKPAVFNGAGPFSDARDFGKERLTSYKTYADLHCLEFDDMGGCKNTKWDDTLEGVFRTPTLINVAKTAPYFHTGEAATLDAVVRHYNKGGAEIGSFVGTKAVQMQPLGLTEQEIADLVSFLESLTGDPPDAAWSANIAKPPLAKWPPAEWTPPPATTM